ncbi:uncharacterized protein LY79DRAFT_7866 [Colletotrichum navitas]|uniref:Uncharacterized protein n=1 Tax=Colletotrichum navitas TaxID=681940 RepID=A0AAD8QCN0_9PEZI|nr:uncharacterized protein LY79DRAFT_7866 [Colletotrichum navitas]KAK1600121.1 hypothetical protein LY79DRAFT_7866 [Colletotrichum navitas]
MVFVICLSSVALATTYAWWEGISLAFLSASPYLTTVYHGTSNIAHGRAGHVSVILPLRWPSSNTRSHHHNCLVDTHRRQTRTELHHIALPQTGSASRRASVNLVSQHRNAVMSPWVTASP